MTIYSIPSFWGYQQIDNFAVTSVTLMSPKILRTEPMGPRRRAIRRPLPALRDGLLALRGMHTGGDFALTTERRLWRGLRSFPRRHL